MNQARRRTETGKYLHLIQGGGQGDGIPRARLTLIQGGLSQNAPDRTYQYETEYQYQFEKQIAELERPQLGIWARFLQWLKAS